MPCKTCGKVANLYIQLSLKHLEISRKSNRILASPSDTRGLKIQQDWFKGKSIGNHVTFNHEIWGGSCKCFPKKKKTIQQESRPFRPANRFSHERHLHTSWRDPGRAFVKAIPIKPRQFITPGAEGTAGSLWVSEMSDLEVSIAMGVSQ